MSVEFQLAARFNGKELLGLDLPIVVMDDDFFEYIEDETEYDGGPLDIGVFAIYYLEWEKEMVK